MIKGRPVFYLFSIIKYQQIKKNILQLLVMTDVRRPTWQQKYFIEY